MRGGTGHRILGLGAVGWTPSLMSWAPLQGLRSPELWQELLGHDGHTWALHACLLASSLSPSSPWGPCGAAVLDQAVPGWAVPWWQFGCGVVRPVAEPGLAH